MGVCSSGMTPEEEAKAARSRQLDRRNRDYAAEEAQKIKLLLLGAYTSAPSAPTDLITFGTAIHRPCAHGASLCASTNPHKYLVGGRTAPPPANAFTHPPAPLAAHQ